MHELYMNCVGTKKMFIKTKKSVWSEQMSASSSSANSIIDELSPWHGDGEFHTSKATHFEMKSDSLSKEV
jgi:hypothetical protein